MQKYQIASQGQSNISLEATMNTQVFLLRIIFLFSFITCQDLPAVFYLLVPFLHGGTKQHLVHTG
jgi:hypothetical protein